MGHAIDTTRAPLGDLAAQRLVNEVAQIGDFAERHYLEIKGPLDMSSKKNQEKIAKFILGASNRFPDIASRAFEGYAVMIVGVSGNNIEGIDRIEMWDIAEYIQPFLGANGPHWDIIRIPVKETNKQVLLVVVDPPKAGQGPFPCRKDGVDIKNGRVYVRADGATREVTADELDSLVQRANDAKKPEAELSVSIIGNVTPVIVDGDIVLEEYIEKTRRELLSALPSAKKAEENESKDQHSKPQNYLEEINEFQKKLGDQISGIFKEAEQRTIIEYEKEIDKWEIEFRSSWPFALLRLNQYLLQPNEIEISNLSTAFLSNVEVDIHLDGKVYCIESFDLPKTLNMDDLGLPSPPRIWGAHKRNFGMIPINNYEFLEPQGIKSFDSKWKNSGSVDINIFANELRPKKVFRTEDSANILMIQNGIPNAICGTWKATAERYDVVICGDISVEVNTVKNLTEPLRHILGIE